MEKYQPSNSDEGIWFTDQFCMRCKHCDPNPEGEKQCEILMRSMLYSSKDPEYPEEWTYDNANYPTCTKFSLWNWDELGNPDDPENPNYIIPVAPNQLNLFTNNDKKL